MGAINEPDLSYAIRLGEIAWGLGLIAISLIIHGFGMTITIVACSTLRHKSETFVGPFLHSALTLILASWMIILVHLLEVLVWALFLCWKGAIPQASPGVYFYFALNDYATLGSSFRLDHQWRLFEGMLAGTGLLSFAWSTGVLLTLAQGFQDHQMQLVQSLRKGRAPFTTRLPALEQHRQEPRTLEERLCVKGTVHGTKPLD